MRTRTRIALHLVAAICVMAGSCLIAIVGLNAVRARAAGVIYTYKVTTSKDDPSAANCNATGTGVTGNNCSLRGAISLANEQGGPSVANILVPAVQIVLTNGTLTINGANNETINITGAAETSTLVNDRSQGDQIFAVDTPATFTNMTIENGGNDQADINGAGMDVEAPVSITRVAFLNNNTGQGKVSSGYAGGAIYTSSGYPLAISNSLFKGNRAEDGGAIYNDTASEYYEEGGSGAYVTIQSTTFQNNYACNYDPCDASTEVGESTGLGGAIYNDNNMSINLSIFSGNQAGSLISDEGYGGGVYNENFLQVSGSRFTGNTAGYEGGALYGDSYTSVNNSSFGQNVAGEYGGGVANEDYGFFSGDQFTGNTAGGPAGGYDGYGGGMYINYWTTISNSTFTGNKALTETNGDRAQPLQAGPHGHYSTRSMGTQQVTEGDPCGGEGGAIYNNDHTTISNTHFTSNSACDGGGIYNDSYPLSINSSTFLSNTATFDGGALYVNDSSPDTVLHDTQAVANHAGDQTGGVFNTDEGDVVFGGTTKLLGNSGGSCPNLTWPCS